MLRSALATVAVVALTVLVLGPAAPSTQDGHWEELGEDGRIFVPAEAPETTDLPPPDLGAYHNVSEAASVMQDLETERPDLFDHEVIGTSHEGRDLHAVTVSAPGDASDRARVLFDGAHHGDEVIASEVLVRYLQTIRDTYDTNDTIQDLLDDVVIDVVPMVNPDGIAHVPNCSYYADCRKNAEGVDLNRNYADHWGETGSSGDPGSATYRGPSPLSEPESQAIADLMDERPYAAYASLHSGAEMVLWPLGWTTDRPAEHGLYDTMGQELSDLTGAPHGQVSHILYSVSGDSMDHAHGSAQAWHPISISPEVYEGSGNAFDWWELFNPPEEDIPDEVDRWTPFLWHLVEESPELAPPELDVPASATIGPDPGEITATIEPPERRGLHDAALDVDTNDLPLVVDPTLPIDLDDGSDTRSVTLTLQGNRAAEGPLDVRLSSPVQGNQTARIDLEIVQVGLELDAEPSTITTPETSRLTATVDAGPFDEVVGDVTFTTEDGTEIGQGSFAVEPGQPATLETNLSGHGLDQGDHDIQAKATFTAWLDGTPEPGEALAETTVHVSRPQVEVTKLAPDQTPAGDPVRVRLVVENTGDRTAQQPVLVEGLPAGYLYWFRDGPLPIPQDPLGDPQPAAIEPRMDGGTDVSFELEAIEPGSQTLVEYRAMPLVPGEVSLPSQWNYTGSFDAGDASYEGNLTVPHEATAPEPSLPASSARR